MSLAEIFYLTSTIVFMIVGFMSLYIGLQIYKFISVIKSSKNVLQKTMTLGILARYSIQNSILKLITKFLKGRYANEKFN